MSQKFNLGQRVVNNTATIVGILENKIYVEIQKVNINIYPWTRFYPDWIHKPVYMIKFDTAQKIMSQDDFIEAYQIKEYVKPEKYTEYYEKYCHINDLMYLPEDAICE